MGVLDEIKEAIIAMKKTETPELTQKALNEGLDAEEILNKALIPAMATVGDQYEKGTKFIPEIAPYFWRDIDGSGRVIFLYLLFIRHPNYDYAIHRSRQAELDGEVAYAESPVATPLPHGVSLRIFLAIRFGPVHESA